MAVLVTGGAGYLGSHLTYALTDRGQDVVVLDNLSTGVRSLVSGQAIFVEGDVADQKLVREILRRYSIDCVVHLAGSVDVSQSIVSPLLYYANNLAASYSLIESCLHERIFNFVYSSTAAVYGQPNVAAVTEDTLTAPTTPYGRSKLMVEWMLEDVARSHGEFRYVTLRHFNVAGADSKGRTGQSTIGAGHVIRNACRVALHRAPYLSVYGTDYPTVDGTGLRDYIHVMDAISAHLMALESLRSGWPSDIYVCGSGHGYTVRQIVAALEEVGKCSLPVKDCGRRDGDIASIVADPAKLKRKLGWQPVYGLKQMLASTLDWERPLTAVPVGLD